jgi:hypothetical protein
MLLFYLVPELLKKKRRQEEYKYPEIPDQVPPPVPDRVPPPAERRQEEPPVLPPVPARRPDVVPPPAAEERPRPVAVVHRPPEPRAKSVEPDYVLGEDPAAPVAAAAEPRPWDGRLDQAAVVNGIIFAEIIQPPRCKRPLRPVYR